MITQTHFSLIPMECYFSERMTEGHLLFLDQLVGTLNTPSSKIRNRLLRLTADSPDFLAVIKKEGQV